MKNVIKKKFELSSNLSKNTLEVNSRLSNVTKRAPQPNTYCILHQMTANDLKKLICGDVCRAVLCGLI